MDFLLWRAETRITERLNGHLSQSRSELAVIPLKYPERGRGFTVKPLPSFLIFEATNFRLYSGFGCAASASRNTFTLPLSSTTVPVSTQVGIGADGAVRQSLNSCTAL